GTLQRVPARAPSRAAARVPHRRPHGRPPLPGPRPARGRVRAAAPPDLPIPDAEPRDEGDEERGLPQPPDVHSRVREEADRDRRGRRRGARAAPLARPPRAAERAVTAAALSAFRCLGCSAEHDLSRALTECPACGSLLEVVSNIQAFGLSGEAWRELFDRRRAALPGTSSRAFEASGVWRYRELVLPDLPEDEIVSKPEGATRLYAPTELGKVLDI